MIYRQIDFHCILKIFEGKQIFEIAKSFNWEDTPPKYPKDKINSYWRNKYNIILSRLNLMEKEGLILVTGNGGSKDYAIIQENVCFKKIKCPDRKFKKSLWIKEQDSDWQMYCV